MVSVAFCQIIFTWCQLQSELPITMHGNLQQESRSPILQMSGQQIGEEVVGL